MNYEVIHEFILRLILSYGMGWGGVPSERQGRTWHKLKCRPESGGRSVSVLDIFRQQGRHLNLRMSIVSSLRKILKVAGGVAREVQGDPAACQVAELLTALPAVQEPLPDHHVL